jgi:hypothetical protein
MKVFNFLAKQGQHNEIARILTENYRKPKLSRYNGKRGKGVMVTLPLDKKESKSEVDRVLHRANVPGSVNRTNLPIFKQDDQWEEKCRNHFGPFIMVINGQMKKYRWKFYNSCTCCGPYQELEAIN